MAFGDLTGNKKEALQEQVAEEQKAKAKSMAMASAAVEEENNDEPVELQTIESRPKPVEVGPEEIEFQEVDETERIREFKVNTDLEQVTIGYANTYDFVRGKTYKAPESIYNYLDEKGVIWH